MRTNKFCSVWPILFSVTVDWYKRSRRVLLSTYFDHASLLTTMHGPREDSLMRRRSVAFQHTPRYSTLHQSSQSDLVENLDFFHLSGCPSEFAIRFGMKKTGGSRGLPDGENIFIRFDTTHESNGRTDTARCALACSVAGLQSHGKNWWKFSINLSNNDYA